MSAVLDYKRKMHAIRDLPTLPVIAQKVLSLADDDEAGTKKLAEIISSDQALSVKVLSLANSAYYGHRAQIGTIRHAVMVIGMNMLKQLSLGVLVCGTLGKRGKNRTEFWKHSFATAMASSMIAQKASMTDLDVCFMAGLLHDVGRMIIDTYFPEDGEMDHTEVGAWMAERWQLPPQLVRAIAHHHSMAPEHLSERIVACVNAANICAKLAMDQKTHELDPEVLRAIGMNNAKFQEAVADLKNRTNEIDRFLT
jgi:putative nucleotidyltransferase with HDIG domain